MSWRVTIVALSLTLVSTLPVVGGELVLSPVQDNTLYEVFFRAPEGESFPSNGAGEYFFAGLTNFSGEARRGLVRFDVASAIPSGSTITDVTLTLEMSRTISGGFIVELHQLLSDWGEGTSDASGEEGAGAPPTTGDATWSHTFYPGAFWASEGGDFSATASAALAVAGEGPYTWGSTPEMVADVQSWLDSPETNFGWLVMGNEAVTGSAKRFNSRENGSGAPQLTVTFQAPVPATPPWTLALLTLLLATLAGWLIRRDLAGGRH